VTTPTPQPERLPLDDYLPEYDLTQIQHKVVDAPTDAAYDRLRHLDFMSSALVRGLPAAQATPERVARRIRRLPPKPPYPRHATLDDMLGPNGWVLLGDQPGREVVLGLLWPFRQAVPRVPEVTPEQWVAFGEPGYAKVAWSLSARSYGTGRTLLTSEARTLCTDPATARRFRLLWRGLGPFAALLKWRMLDMAAGNAS